MNAAAQPTPDRPDTDAPTSDAPETSGRRRVRRAHHPGHRHPLDGRLGESRPRPKNRPRKSPPPTSRRRPNPRPRQPSRPSPSPRPPRRKRPSPRPKRPRPLQPQLRPLPPPPPGRARVRRCRALRRPRSSPRGAPSAPPGAASTTTAPSVREGDDWRAVGQYPDGTPAEALAYFERKYSDLASEVTLLEVRHRRGGASAATCARPPRPCAASSTAPPPSATSPPSAPASTPSRRARHCDRDRGRRRPRSRRSGRAQRTARRAGRGAGRRDPKTVQWKQTTADMAALFDQWQAHQQNGPRLSKSTAQQLWRRFRDARATVDRHRREFYAELDETDKVARDRKTRLVERAEALAPRGEDGIGAYRDLLDAWKASAARAARSTTLSGHVSRPPVTPSTALASSGSTPRPRRRKRRSSPDGAARRSGSAPRREEHRDRATAAHRHPAPLGRDRSHLPARRRACARRRPAQDRADDARPREADWKRNNPETKARANDMTRQSHDAIDKLEAELDAARSAGDRRPRPRPPRHSQPARRGCPPSAADPPPHPPQRPRLSTVGAVARTAVVPDTRRWAHGVALPLLRRRAPVGRRADGGAPGRRCRGGGRGIHARRCRRDVRPACGIARSARWATARRDRTSAPRGCTVSSMSRRPGTRCSASRHVVSRRRPTCACATATCDWAAATSPSLRCRRHHPARTLADLARSRDAAERAVA